MNEVLSRTENMTDAMEYAARVIPVPICIGNCWEVRWKNERRPEIDCATANRTRKILMVQVALRQLGIVMHYLDVAKACAEAKGAGYEVMHALRNLCAPKVPNDRKRACCNCSRSFKWEKRVMYCPKCADEFGIVIEKKERD